MEPARKKSEPKEHHFVPQFYLRAFSENRKQVNLYNFARGQVIPGAPIKSQCARHNFHAFAPGLEQALGGLENEAAAAIRTVLSNKGAPKAGTKEWAALLAFVVFQKSRTERSEHTINVTADFLAKARLKHDPALKDIDLDKFEIKSDHAISVALQLVDLAMAYASDLGMHLLLNESPVDFFTSDDPVVAHNQYCEGITYRGCLGWNCRGLQLFLPLSPRAALFMYDPAIYKVEGSRHGELAATVKDPEHVGLINHLQALNAHRNLYFRGDPNSATQRFFEAMRAKRVDGRTAFVETEPTQRPNGEMSQILHTFEPMLPVALNLPQISIRRRARRVALDARSTQYRHEPKERHFGCQPPRWLHTHERYSIQSVTRR